MPLLGKKIQMFQGAQQNTAQWRNQEGRKRVLAMVGNPGSDVRLLDALSLNSLKWHSCQEWREIALATPAQGNLIRAFLGIRLRNNNGADLDPQELVPNMDFWKTVVGEDEFQHLITQKAQRGGLSTALPDLAFDLALQDIYALVLRADGTKAYCKFLVGSLTQLTEEEWLGVLCDESAVVEIAVSLKARGLTLGQAFQDALASHAGRRFSQSGTGRLVKSWKTLLTLF